MSSKLRQLFKNLPNKPFTSAERNRESKEFHQQTLTLKGGDMVYRCEKDGTITVVRR